MQQTQGQTDLDMTPPNRPQATQHTAVYLDFATNK
jgi:hypothetical protein